MDKSLLIGNLITGISLVFACAYLLFVGVGMARRQRAYVFYPWYGKFAAGLLLLLPFLAGIYLVPFALGTRDFGPEGFGGPFWAYTDPLAWWAIGSVLFCYVVFFAGSLFPHHNKYYNLVPILGAVSLLPSIGNASIIFIVTAFLNQTGVPLAYLGFYFILCVYLYVTATKFVKTRVLDVSNSLIHDLNMLIINKVFNTSYQNFEKIKKGKLFTILNEDVERITAFFNNTVNLYTGLFTVLILIVYLLTINLWASLLLVSIVTLILSLHYSMGKRTTVMFNNASTLRDRYMDGILGIANGFKELVLHQVKRTNYRDEIERISISYNAQKHQAFKIYINRILLSDMSFILSIGISSFLLPVLLELSMKEITAYVIGALYLWGPMNVIVGSVPEVVNLRVSWNRIQEFIKSIPEKSRSRPPVAANPVTEPAVNYDALSATGIQVTDLTFRYGPGTHEDDQYGIGPVNFEAREGEITFIIGGNGSGKTTLAKLLTGLYAPAGGTIHINGASVKEEELGEYFSVIFSDFYLFEKLYMLNDKRKYEVENWLKILNLDGKVHVENGRFSTIELSRGQCKRLAMLQCYLEDRPIVLFDECAADQDPEFKQFFYTEMLPRLKALNKILIIITHDDRYFRLADRIFKMESGNMRRLETVDLQPA